MNIARPALAVAAIAAAALALSGCVAKAERSGSRMA